MSAPLETDLKLYDFDLPPELIAQQAAEPRDSSRLLVVHSGRTAADPLPAGTIEHRTFRDLPEYLGPRDLLVANNTRVLNARLIGHRLLSENVNEARVLGGKIEFLMLEKRDERTWEGAFHAAAKHKPGIRFWVPTPDGVGIIGELIRGASESASGTVVARFDRDPVDAGAGELPLPSYITRPGPGPGNGTEAESAAHLAADAGVSRGPTIADQSRYQTVYAKALGSAAAPTAGLHFTQDVMARLREQGVGWEELTLHVGLGTFRPVKSEDIRQHVMHEERYEVSNEAAARITAARRQGQRIIAVGTTSVRTLESAWVVEKEERDEARSLTSGNRVCDDHGGHLRAGPGRTSIFIHPGGVPFQVIGGLITNFHLPKSTLLMLVSAWGGRELILRAYREAVEQRYRFFSYGDCMLIL